MSSIDRTSLVRVIPTLFLSLLVIGGLGMGCNDVASQAQDTSLDSASPIPDSFPTPNPSNLPVPPASAQVSTVGPACVADSSHECIGLKYVVYEDSTGTPVVSQGEAISNIAQVNTLWSQCNIAFQIDQYVSANPTQYGLVFDTANSADLDTIRQDFSDNQSFLVVTTGTWDRTGTLGSTQANAWTNLPGDTIFGSVLEEPVGGFAPIIAHELGHYMNLAHVSDTSNLMNPIIYNTSATIASDQCDGARRAIEYFWTSMKR